MLPLAIRSKGRPELNKYVLDYSAYLPAGASLSYTIPHITSKESTQTTITSNGAKLGVPDGSEGLLLIGSPSQITYQKMILITASSMSSVTSPLPSDFDKDNPKSVNSILNNETGASTFFTQPRLWLKSEI